MFKSKQKWTATILAFILGISTLALAVPMTPVENGGTWIAHACYDEKNNVRTDGECCIAKCRAIYPMETELQKFQQCYHACIMTVMDITNLGGY